MTWKSSRISHKYPTYRNSALVTTFSWLDGKREDDNAEGLWRIYDSLYDLTDFIHRHPGGPDWLLLTKGHDVTELFEAHHLTENPYQMMAKFKVRDAKEPRNITLTMHEDGFYKTLKRCVIEKLKTIDCTKYSKKSDIIHTTMLILVYLLSIFSGVLQSKLLAFVTGLFVTWTVIISHNYFHRRDNWRMYIFNLSFMNYKDWRILHALSHHMFPNSFHDLELSLNEPFFCWVPNPHIKNFIQRYGSWIYSPFVWTANTMIQVIQRALYTIVKGHNVFDLSDLIPFTIPLAMYLASDVGLFKVLQIWITIILSASFIFGLIGFNAAHHHPDIFHDGDVIRDNRDWGLYQMDSIIDRRELKGSQFLVLTHFGDHVLHHLFPTLDHGILPHLYPVLYETIDQFEGELREHTWFHHIVGQFKQLARVTPNLNKPKK